MNQLIINIVFVASLTLLTGCGPSSSSSSSTSSSSSSSISEAVSKCEQELISSNDSSSLPDSRAEIEAKADRDMKNCMASHGY